MTMHSHQTRSHPPESSRPKSPSSVAPEFLANPPLQRMIAPQPQFPMNRTQIMQLQKAIGNQSVSQLLNAHTLQKKENKTGMPDRLKEGLESMSGMDLSDVRVHYGSNKPAQVGALAYAQGNQIHLGPGQEQHLPHEGWHVVQQRQGRVQPNSQVEGIAVNNDKGLEREADRMGQMAMTGAVVQKMQMSSPMSNASTETLQMFPPTYVEEDNHWVDDELPGLQFPTEKAAITAYMDSYKDDSDKLAIVKEHLKRENIRKNMMEKEALQDRDLTRRKSPRTLAKEEKDREAREKFQLPGAPKLHRGNSFEDLREHKKSKAIAAARESFMEQLPDSKGNVKRPNSATEEFQEQAKQLYEQMKDSREVQVNADEFGRPVRVVARLDGYNMVGDKESPPDPKGQRLNTAIDDRGHLITESLVDPSRHLQVNSTKNIIAENRLINQGYKRGLELAAQDMLTLGKSIVQISDVTYEGDRPGSVVHTYVIDGENVVTVQLNNPDKKLM